MKSSKVIKIVGTFVLLLSLIIVGYLIFNGKGENKEEEKETEIADTTENDDDRVVSKDIDYSIDTYGNLQLIADITLSTPLAINEQIDITVNVYNKSDKLLETYLASTQIFKIDNQTEVHVGFDISQANELEGIKYILTEVKINEKTVESTVDYEFVVNEAPEVVEYVSLYRVFMDLSDYYYTNSGFAALEYEDKTRTIQRISYLSNTDYIGVSSFSDFTKNSKDSKLVKVSVYRITYAVEK